MCGQENTTLHNSATACFVAFGELEVSPLRNQIIKIKIEIKHNLHQLVEVQRKDLAVTTVCTET